MRKSLPLLLSAIFITTGCSDMFEKQLDVYEEAYNDLDDFDEFPELMNEVFNRGMEIARIVATTDEEDINELKEDYGEEYDVMRDSIEKMHDRYYKRADELFLKHTYNFVERRTMLYKAAAERYCNANYMEELNSIKKTLKRYSALSFVESQRVCDPPVQIRKEYEAAKELADNCYDVAKKRILNEKEEQQ